MPQKRTTPNLTRRSALRLAAVTAGLGMLSNPRAVLADTKSDLASAQSKLADAEARLGEIAAQYEELSTAQSKTLDELDAVETKIEQTNKRIVELEDRLRAKQGELSVNVSEEYKDGKHGVVDLVLAATTIEELISNLYYYDKVTEEKARLIQEVKDAHDALQNERAQLEEQQKNLKEVSQTQAEQLEAMRDKQYEAQKLIDGLDKEVRDLLAKRDAELLAAKQEAEQARKQREEAQKAAESKPSQSSGQPSSSATDKPVQETATPAEQSAPATEQSSPATEQTAPAETPAQEEPAPAEAPAEESYGGSSGRGGNGTGSAAAVVNACYSTPSPGAGLCAGWCSNVMANAGYGYVSGNANDMYAEFCFSSNRADLMPGMAVAVSTHPNSVMGRIYGHIGMYIGGGMMMDNIGYIRTISVDEWCAYYGGTVAPRWGWLNGIVLS